MTNKMKTKKLVRGEKVPCGIGLVSDKTDREQKATDCGAASFECTL